MPAVDLKRLVDRFDETCRQALEASAGRTLSRTHFNVEIEHLLMQLLEIPMSDAACMLRHSDLDAARVAADLGRALDRMRTGNGRAPGLAPELVDVARDAWVFGSVEYGAPALRSGHLLWAMLSHETAGPRLCAVSPPLRDLLPDILRRDFETLSRDSIEGATAPARTEPLAGSALDRFTVDLTARARLGEIDPVLGREMEIRQLTDILTRRRQNNPILTGEAGVGKTAVVEGFALRVAAGDVPPALRDCAVRALDLGLLQAGAGIRGEFENRLRGVIDGVRESKQPIILFIDEAHTLVGAGGAPGQGDATNLLKPALARGELRTIAATTWAEYKRYFETDAALTRRFQVVKVEQPDEARAIAMVRGAAALFEQHHGVRILDEAVVAAVRLSTRYIPDRQLPDKAISLIDTACSRVAMSRAATPAAVEDRQRRLEMIETERSILAREAETGLDHASRAAELDSQAEGARADLAALQARWADERALTLEIDGALAGLSQDGGDRDEIRAGLARANAALRGLQGEHPLVFPVVDTQAVAAIVEGWTGIPTGRMTSGDIDAVLTLREALGRRVVGQDHALEAVARAIRTSRAGLTDPRKPVGVFLMVGTSGVGKTETALALAELLYGGEQNLTIINMSEFKEEHRVSLLLGSPPGYVGYGEGGVLTEAVRRRPYSVILLDEMEKAHPGVQDIFYQVFDKGMLKDGDGSDVDFRNTVIIMTSNAGSALIGSLFADAETAPDAASLTEALRPELARHFKPAFLGRVSVVPYVPLSAETLRRIARLQIERVARRIRKNFGAVTECGAGIDDFLAARTADASAGARSIENMLARTLLPELAGQVLARLQAGQPIERVSIEIGDAESLRCTLH